MSEGLWLRKLQRVAATELVAKLVFRFRDLLTTKFIGRLRIAYYGLLGMRIGPRTSLGRIEITWPHQVQIGANCMVETGVRFKYDGTYAVGPRIVLGSHVFLGANCELNIRQGLIIGDYCLIGSNSYFIDRDHGFTTRDVHIRDQSVGRCGPICLERDVWLGANCVILRDVTIGQGSVIAAGSVVSRSIPAYEVWGGVPARKIRNRP